jgi:hypothetical protein
MLKALLFAALAGLSLGALDNMADARLAGFIGLALIVLSLFVIAKAAR